MLYFSVSRTNIQNSFLRVHLKAVTVTFDLFSVFHTKDRNMTLILNYIIFGLENIKVLRCTLSYSKSSC